MLPPPGNVCLGKSRGGGLPSVQTQVARPVFQGYDLIRKRDAETLKINVQSLFVKIIFFRACVFPFMFLDAHRRFYKLFAHMPAYDMRPVVFIPDDLLNPGFPAQRTPSSWVHGRFIAMVERTPHQVGKIPFPCLCTHQRTMTRFLDGVERHINSGEKGFSRLGFKSVFQ